MNSELRRRRQYVDLSVTGYLARWVNSRFEHDATDGGVLLPVQLAAHHCVWHLLERRGRRRRELPGETNLRLHLLYHREGGYKDPAFWNYLSPRSCVKVERELRRLFYMEVRHWMQTCGEPLAKDRCHAFCRQYGLTLDDEDTVLRTWRRLVVKERESVLQKKSRI